MINKKTMDKAVIVAEQIHDYMTFRAASENREHTLGVDYYWTAICEGYQFFFGIYYDLDKGIITKDTQNPKAFEAWKAEGRYD
jgi:hypothetical protein